MYSKTKLHTLPYIQCMYEYNRKILIVEPIRTVTKVSLLVSFMTVNSNVQFRLTLLYKYIYLYVGVENVFFSKLVQNKKIQRNYRFTRAMCICDLTCIHSVN